MIFEATRTDSVGIREAQEAEKKMNKHTKAYVSNGLILMIAQDDYGCKYVTT